MNKIYPLVFIEILLSLFFVACDKDLYDPENPEIAGLIEQYAPGVTIINKDMVDNVEILNDTTINIFSKEPLENIFKVGSKFVYCEEASSRNFFVGIVKELESQGGKFAISTTIPSFADIFSSLEISPMINSEDLSYDFVGNEDDNVIFKGIVSNDIWGDIESVYQETDSIRKDSRSSSRNSSSVPIDITLSFEVKPNQAFTGNVYLRLQGDIYIHDSGCFEMNVNQIVGLQGSFSMVSKSSNRQYIPLLEIKNGITLYSNKIVGIRLKPSLNFFYGGEIKLEAGFKYEVMNANCNVKYANGSFSNISKDNKKDAYFRVKSLHTEAEFGLSLNSDLYAFIFTDRFFSGGAKLVGGLAISGEKNVGIQFPDIANFDFSVSFSPIFEVTPFATIRTTTLKRYDGPTFKANTDKFSVDLLPNIHDINYKRASNSLNVNSKINSQSTSFIKTKEDGIALFKKGADTPLVLKNVQSAKSRASSQSMSFDLEVNEDYEIARYSISELGEKIYGERIPIYADWMEVFYNSTNGDKWANNTNWLSEKPLDQWYGVNYNGSEINLSNNNLTGDGIIKNAIGLYNIVLTGNNLNSLYFENCPGLDLGYGFKLDGIKLNSLIFNKCMESDGQHFLGSEYKSPRTEIKSITFENINNLGRVFFDNVISDIITFRNCNFNDQGSSCEYQSNVTTLCFDNCVVPSGRLDNENGNLIIKDSRVGDFWVIHGRYISISNTVIEGRMVNFSGTEEQLYKYWYGY